MSIDRRGKEERPQFRSIEGKKKGDWPSQQVTAARVAELWSRPPPPRVLRRDHAALAARARPSSLSAADRRHRAAPRRGGFSRRFCGPRRRYGTTQARDYLLERLPKAAEAAGVAAGENGADDVEFEMKPFVDDLFSR